MTVVIIISNWQQVTNIGVATFGLPGYTLKGVERELQKHHLTYCKAEIILIRLRQGIEAFRNATPRERDGVVCRWQKHIQKKGL